MRLLVYSNLYIALAATLLTQASYWLLGIDARWDALSGLVFSATLLVYNLDRLVSSSKEDAVAETERHAWIAARSQLLWGLVVAGGIGAVVSLFFLEARLWYVLVPLGLVSLAYSLPVIRSHDGARRLKDVPGIKIFVIAFVWATVTVILPALNADVSLEDQAVWLLAAERLVYIFAITLPFDVRDMVRDEASGITTIPMVLGLSRTRQLSVGLMVLFVGLCAAHYELSVYSPGFSLVVFGALTSIMLWLTGPERTELYYVGLLDGTMFLYYAAAVLPVLWS